MLGVDPADRGDIKRWSDAGVQFFNPMLAPDARREAEEASEALRAYFRAGSRAPPRSARRLDQHAHRAEESGDRLSDAGSVDVRPALTAGNVTTTDLIGNGTLALLRNPGELQKLRDDPSLIKNAVEEILRYDPPVTQSGRTPLSPVEIGGCPIAPSQSVTPSLAAANHDPDVYAEPHRFDITREDTHHHSFGGGAHFCLGAPLARLEAQIGINAMVQRFPNLRLADEPLEYRNIPSFRGLVKLHVLV
jgi:cytochrome P450